MMNEDYKAPCKDCLVFAICQNRSLLDLLRDCDEVRNYLHIASHTISKPKFEIFCDIMGKTITKSGCDYIVKERK